MTNKWMTSGAMRLKANLNRSFGARKNKKSAATHRPQIKNYESIVVSHRRGGIGNGGKDLCLSIAFSTL